MIARKIALSRERKKTQAAFECLALQDRNSQTLSLLDMQYGSCCNLHLLFFPICLNAFTFHFVDRRSSVSSSEFLEDSKCENHAEGSCKMSLREYKSSMESFQTYATRTALTVKI